MIGKLWAKGQLDVVIDTILFVIALSLALGFIGCCLCFWSSYQFPKRKLAFEPEFYENLAKITKQKNDDKMIEYQKYKKYGIKMHDRAASSDQINLQAQNANKRQLRKGDSLVDQLGDLKRVS